MCKVRVLFVLLHVNFIQVLWFSIVPLFRSRNQGGEGFDIVQAIRVKYPRSYPKASHFLRVGIDQCMFVRFELSTAVFEWDLAQVGQVCFRSLEGNTSFAGNLLGVRKCRVVRQFIKLFVSKSLSFDN